MEGIHAALAARSVLLGTFRDPFGSIASGDLDTGKLFRRQEAVELLQHLLAVPVRSPHDGVGIMIDDNSDVLVTLAVAGLINPDVDKTFEPAGTFRLDVTE